MKKKRKLIGVILSDVTSDYSARLLVGIIAQAKEYDYDVAVFSTFVKAEGAKKHNHGEQNIFKLPNYDNFDGIIIVPDTIRIEGVAAEIETDLDRKCKCPVVCADRSPSIFPKIPTDEAKDFKQIVNHFIIEHGFTRINCLTGPKDSLPAELRLQGYKDALMEHNIPIEEHRYYYGDFWREAGKTYVDQMMQSLDALPQAIVCASDYMALTVCNALKEYGLRVPEDISISGYDNMKEASLNSPSITTFKTPIEGIGRRAVKHIQEHILGVEHIDNSALRGEMVIAESCSCVDKDISFRNYIKKEKNYQYELDCIIDEVNVMNLMGENLIGISTLQDFFVGLSEHMHLLKDYRDFYLCLCEGWDTIEQGDDAENLLYLKDGYSNNMRLEIAVKNKEHIKGHYNFPVEDMLPALYDENETMKTYFFVPIHFKDRCFGYAALTFGNQIKVFDFTYRSWIRNINNTLELVRVQNNLRWCYDQLEEIAAKDALTNLYNRRGFDRYAGDVFESCVASQKPFQLLLGDLDDLKMINDDYGHMEGDKAIKMVAKAFQSIDAEDSVYARIGGDEFVIVFRGNYTEQQILSYKQDINNYLITFNRDNNYPYIVDSSIGMYYGIPSADVTITDCITIADKRMYSEKHRKKQV